MYSIRFRSKYVLPNQIQEGHIRYVRMAVPHGVRSAILW